MNKPFGFVKQSLNYSKIEIQGVKCKGCKGCSSCKPIRINCKGCKGCSSCKNNTEEKCSIM
jgi:hypothetical protein